MLRSLQPQSDSLLPMLRKKSVFRGCGRTEMSGRSTLSGYFWLVAVWIASMVILLFVEQECGRRGASCLSDAVLMTALGTTTASVISILAFVGRYLFKQT